MRFRQSLPALSHERLRRHCGHKPTRAGGCRERFFTQSRRICLAHEMSVGKAERERESSWNGRIDMVLACNSMLHSICAPPPTHTHRARVTAGCRRLAALPRTWTRCLPALQRGYRTFMYTCTIVLHRQIHIQVGTPWPASGSLFDGQLLFSYVVTHCVIPTLDAIPFTVLFLVRSSLSPPNSGLRAPFLSISFFIYKRREL
jgi:hypothetical protein